MISSKTSFSKRQYILKYFKCYCVLIKDLWMGLVGKESDKTGKIKTFCDVLNDCQIKKVTVQCKMNTGVNL